MPWWILRISEYYMYERHGVYSCSAPCNDILHKRSYAVGRSLKKEIRKVMRNFRFNPLCTWGFLSSGMIRRVGWHFGAAYRSHLQTSHNPRRWDRLAIPKCQSDRQPTRHNICYERKSQVQLAVPKALWPPANAVLVISQKNKASIWTSHFKIFSFGDFLYFGQH